MALDTIVVERKRVADDQAARDVQLIERGARVGLQRALGASKVNERLRHNEGDDQIPIALSTYFRAHRVNSGVPP